MSSVIDRAKKYVENHERRSERDDRDDRKPNNAKKNLKQQFESVKKDLVPERIELIELLAADFNKNEYEVYEVLLRYDWNETIARDQLRVMSEWSETTRTQNWGENRTEKRDDKAPKDRANDYPAKTKAQDYKDGKYYDRRDYKGRDKDNNRRDGYDERGYNESYYDYDGTQESYGYKSSYNKRDKPYSNKTQDRYTDQYFVKKDNFKADDDTEYVRIKPSTTEDSKQIGSTVSKDQVKESSKQAHHTHDQKDTRHEHDVQSSSKQHQTTHQSSHYTQGQSATKKRKFYEDDGSDDQEVYSALLNNQKSENTRVGSKNTYEQPQTSHQTGTSKADHEVKTGLKPQTSGGNKTSHNAHHVQEKSEITPPPGIQQRTENSRSDAHSHSTAADKEGRHQNSSSKTKDRHDHHGSSHHSTGYQVKETESRDHKSHQDSKSQHNAAINSSSAGQGHAVASSQNASVTISPSLSALPQIPTFFMAQQVTTLAADGSQIQQVMLVPMGMMQAPAHVAGSNHGAQVAGVPPGAPFMFAPPTAPVQRPGHATDAHSHGAHGHVAAPTASIYCLVPIHTLPYHPPQGN